MRNLQAVLKMLLKRFRYININNLCYQIQTYNAYFVDIDINVSVKDLEKLVNLVSINTKKDESIEPKIYCIFCKFSFKFIIYIARDIEKSKAKIL